MSPLSRLTLTIDAPCEWINSNQRLHRMEMARRTREWRFAAYNAGLPIDGMFEDHVRIVATVHKTRGGKWDAGNLYPTAKAVVDGLVDAGLFVDDSNRYVTGPDMRPGEKRDKSSVVVHIAIAERDAA